MGIETEGVSQACGIDYNFFFFKKETNLALVGVAQWIEHQPVN